MVVSGGSIDFLPAEGDAAGNDSYTHAGLEIKVRFAIARYDARRCDEMHCRLPSTYRMVIPLAPHVIVVA